jgi:hypothetical protein
MAKREWRMTAAAITIESAGRGPRFGAQAKGKNPENLTVEKKSAILRHGARSGMQA